MKEFTLINIPELSDANDKFVDLNRYSGNSWIRLSGKQRNWLERKIARPKLSRYRGALEAIVSTHHYKNPVVVSHMPAMSAAIGAMDVFANKCKKHIAFSFNFTDLPTENRKSYFCRSLKNIDKFVVFSNYEKMLYADYFGLPTEKLESTLWAQDPPPLNCNLPPLFSAPYLCAIGGEGRDFGVMLDAANKTQIPLVIIARPSSLANLTIPNNVRILSNLPLDVTWGIARQSKGVLVPLKSATTCCGQITVISTCMLGLPLITTKTHALADYIINESATLTHNFGDSDDLAEKMCQLVNDNGHFTRIAEHLAPSYIARHSRSLWTDCIENCLDKF